MASVSIQSTHLEDWQIYKEHWSCHSCSEICNFRKRTVLFRGSIPCDVLYIGEAPGQSENITGEPFKGPSGELLNDIISAAEGKASETSPTFEPLRHGFTNLIACIPPAGPKGHLRQPNATEIAACRDRLIHLIDLVTPRLIVTCGLVPKKHFNQYDLIRDILPETYDVYRTMTNIIHPSSILRIDDEQEKALAFKKAYLDLSIAFLSVEENL